MCRIGNSEDIKRRLECLTREYNSLIPAINRGKEISMEIAKIKRMCKHEDSVVRESYKCDGEDYCIMECRVCGATWHTKILDNRILPCVW